MFVPLPLRPPLVRLFGLGESWLASGVTGAPKVNPPGVGEAIKTPSPHLLSLFPQDEPTGKRRERGKRRNFALHPSYHRCTVKASTNIFSPSSSFCSSFSSSTSLRGKEESKAFPRSSDHTMYSFFFFFPLLPTSSIFGWFGGQEINFPRCLSQPPPPIPRLAVLGPTDRPRRNS